MSFNLKPIKIQMFQQTFVSMKLNVGVIGQTLDVLMLHTKIVKHPPSRIEQD